MKLLLRKKYLDTLTRYKDKPFIKIIVGIRKVGKSTILKQFYDSIADKKANKHFFDFNDFEFKMQVNNKFKLHEIIKKNYKKEVNNYFFFDEIQAIDEFQEVLNSGSNYKNVDIYVAGSNSKLLSSEISTLITAKNITLTVYPLVFSEYYAYAKNELHFNRKQAFENYFKYGGMPGRLH
jgi:predicted AAA+ superfamily ATPase